MPPISSLNRGIFQTVTNAVVGTHPAATAVVTAIESPRLQDGPRSAPTVVLMVQEPFVCHSDSFGK